LENQMEMNQMSNRIHPLMAAAAVSVVLVSLLGAAAITGVLPNSHAGAGETSRVAVQSASVDPIHTSAQQNTEHSAVVHHHPARQVEASQQVARAPTYSQAAPAAPVAKNSPIGIGIGAVVGGLLGNQVGSGDGKTLATIAGAVGGGYVGNEIAKKY
jgi:uncharacterized protein YcfJ